MKLTKEQLKLSEEQFKLFKEAEMFLSYGYGAWEHLGKEDKPITDTELLREMEMYLHYAHEAMRKLNKDIHCDDGQEYPVPLYPNRKGKQMSIVIPLYQEPQDDKFPEYTDPKELQEEK